MSRAAVGGDAATVPAACMGVFLRGEPLPIEAGRDGSPAEWAEAARQYLSRAVSGASGAATVRVSVAALSLVLGVRAQVEVGADG